MPSCSVKDCDNETPKTRGVAAAEGWIVVDVHGPRGNKYINLCPDHRDEAQEHVEAALEKVTPED
jgi:endonuclease III